MIFKYVWLRNNDYSYLVVAPMVSIISHFDVRPCKYFSLISNDQLHSDIWRELIRLHQYSFIQIAVCIATCNYHFKAIKLAIFFSTLLILLVTCIMKYKFPMSCMSHHTSPCFFYSRWCNNCLFITPPPQLFINHSSETI